MRVINYTVRNQYKEIEKGTLSDMSQDEAIGYLQDKGYVVIHVAESVDNKKEHVDSLEEERDFKLPKRRFHKKSKLDDLIVFARQMSVLLDAGVTLLKSLTLLSQQIESLALYQAVGEVRQDIESGASFKDALSKHPKIFSQYWVSLVETGEATGQLATVMDELARYLEKSGALRRKIVSALIYPALLFVASIAAIMIFMAFIIPVFSGIFESADVPLPTITRMVVFLSNFMRTHFFILMIISGGVGYGLYYYVKTDRGKWNLDKLVLQLPLFGLLLRRVASAQFANSLSTLIKSGTPIVSSMDILIHTSDNKVFQKALERVRENVKEGKGMADPLARSGVFPLLVSQMVSVGEETGELSNVLSKLAKFYEERVSATVERMTSLFEPLMLIVMGSIVGVLVIAMFLPIFKMGQIVR